MPTSYRSGRVARPRACLPASNGSLPHSVRQSPLGNVYHLLLLCLFRHFCHSFALFDFLDLALFGFQFLRFALSAFHGFVESCLAAGVFLVFGQLRKMSSITQNPRYPLTIVRSSLVLFVAQRVACYARRHEHSMALTDPGTSPLRAAVDGLVASPTSAERSRYIHDAHARRRLVTEVDSRIALSATYGAWRAGCSELSGGPCAWQRRCKGNHLSVHQTHQSSVRRR